MSIDEPERRLLALEMRQDAGQNGMLEDVSEIAGMKGVTVVDLNCPRCGRRSHPRQAADSTGVVQRTGATAIDPRWQLCRATLRQIA